MKWPLKIEQCLNSQSAYFYTKIYIDTLQYPGIQLNIQKNKKIDKWKKNEHLIPPGTIQPKPKEKMLKILTVH